MTVGNLEVFDRIVQVINSNCDEKVSRILLAGMSELYGHGGKSRIHEITGMAQSTLRRGEKEFYASVVHDTSKIRSEGGGRKHITEQYPDLEENIEKIVEGDTYGDPQRVLLYTTLSLRDIAEAVKTRFNIAVSYVKVGQILEKLDYSKQQNQKNLQVGEPHPDRNAQFEFINEKAIKFIEAGDPVISIDTKKKELIGNFKNNGSEYRKQGEPRQVLDHDFELPELGKVAPYGVYVLNDNTGFVNLGTDHDTSEFAAESICRWWFTVGKETFPNVKRIYINADGGGSNRPRGWQWKYQLQQIADITGLEIHMSHFPPGTSKWNKIEHRLFCYITKNWQGKPLIDVETVVNLISNTTTKKELKVKCVVDTNTYELKKEITDDMIGSINLEECDQFGKWNYIIRPSN